MTSPDALRTNDPLNVRYDRAIVRSQGGAHDNNLKRMRFYVMQQLAIESLCRFPQGSIIECGCWRGHSTLILEDILVTCSTGLGDLHTFDSFEGLSEFGPLDTSPRFPTWREVQEVRQSFRSDFDRLSGLIDKQTTKLHKGWIPDVFDGVDVGKVAFAHIDVDLYQPTLDSLHFVYPRLIDGGTVFLDDYGYSEVFPGATCAVDQFIAQTRPAVFVKLPMGSAFFIK